MAGQKFDFSKYPGKSRMRTYAPDPKNALVSVITPFYNAGKYFEQTFNSVMNQTFPWFEWVIVNDGSTKEEDVQILETFAAMDHRITVINQKNAGPSAARNNAIAHANTELIVPLDADDLIDPTYLECLYWSLYYNPQAAWSYTNSYGFQGQEYIWNHKFSASEMKRFNFLNYTAMIRKKDINEIGGYKVEDIPYHEDWRFWLDMLSAGKQVVRVGSFLFWYRRLESGRMSSIVKDSELTKKCDAIIREAAATVDTSIEAKVYPLTKTEYPFHRTEYKKWELKANEHHEKKNVLWLIPWMTIGGADKFNLDAIAGLKERNFNNYIIMTQGEKEDWRQRFEDYTADIYNLPAFLDPAHYLEYISYFIQTREIDVIMLTDSYDGYYMMPWIRQHFPQVAIVDYVHMEEWYWREGGYARTSGTLAGITEKTYVCNSATKNVMCEHFGRSEDSVECLYIGVDHQYFAKDQEHPGYLREKLQLEEDRPIILFPCRIHPQKRPFMMLDIAELVARKIPKAAFVVVGDGPQLKKLKSAIRKRHLSDTVYCIGRTDEMRACYRDSAITLICSLKEGLALTAYESLAMGVPVISSDVGGQRDLIGPDVGALIPLSQNEGADLDNREFDPIEIRRYVKCIVRLLEDKTLYEKISRAGRRKIENGFTIDKMVERLASEFERLCSDPDAVRERKIIAEKLADLDVLVNEYYTIYQQYLMKDQECNLMWKSYCRAVGIYNDEDEVEPTTFKGKVKYEVKKPLRKVKRGLKKMLY